MILLLLEKYWYFYTWNVLILWHLTCIDTWNILILLILETYLYFWYLKYIDTFNTLKFLYFKTFQLSKVSVLSSNNTFQVPKLPMFEHYWHVENIVPFRVSIPFQVLWRKTHWNFKSIDLGKHWYSKSIGIFVTWEVLILLMLETQWYFQYLKYIGVDFWIPHKLNCFFGQFGSFFCLFFWNSPPPPGNL